jgi:hypothetical protein
VTNAVGTELAANLYSNGDLELKGGGTVYGQVEAQGFITLSGATDVKTFVTAKGPLTISNNSIVRSNARSSTSTVTNGGVVNGNAYYCTGSAPGGTVGGSKIHECPNPVQPIAQGFHGFTFVASDWTGKGYTVNTYTTCSAAESFLAGLGSAAAANYVVRITNTCATTIPTVALKGSLAIISNGDINGTGSTSITVSGGGTPNPPYTLSIMGNILNSPAATGGPVCASNSGISMVAGVTYPAGVDVLFYTPCDVKFTGNATANIQGQIISGRDVKFSSGSNITYKPIYVPGISPTGFAESLHYRREVKV